MLSAHENKILTDEVGSYFADLGAWLKFAYPWKEKNGPLEHFDGPEEWVMRLADDISNQVAKNAFDGVNPVPVIYVAIASGNGAAKSAFAGMVNNWIMSTRPECRGTVSANTGAQLRTKTWTEIAKWSRLSITAPWFEIQNETIYEKLRKDSWFCQAHTWNIANPTASAGQHARESTSYYIIDESSRVPEPILDEMDGGLTDGEPMFFLLGNCTNRASRLFRAVFGNLQGQYIHRSIDTRKCKYTNKDRIKKWGEERGEDSDWFKAHVKGEAPSADDLQLIDTERVQRARHRAVPETDDSVPLIMGIDFSRGGSGRTIIRYRRGRDGRSIPARRIPGEKTRDTTLMVSLVAAEIDERKPDAVFGDAGAMGGPILDRLRQLGYRQVHDVMFGSSAPDNPKDKRRYGNMRAYMWFQMKEWLDGGAIDDLEQLEIDLTGPGFYEDKSDRSFLESKEDMEDRGLASPDDGDALALTFAQSVAPKQNRAFAKPKVTMPAKRKRTNWMRR